MSTVEENDGRSKERIDMKNRKLNRLSFFGQKLSQAVILAAGFCLTLGSTLAQTLAQFDFNEGSGNTVASKVGGLVGTLGVAAINPANLPVSIPGPSGTAGDNAVQLQGTGFLAVDDRSSPILMIHTNTFTIEAWVYFDPSDVRVNEGVVSYGTSGTTLGYKLGFNNRQLRFTLYTIVDINSGLFIPLDGAWHHVAVVWQPGVGATFYLDGGDETFKAETRPIPVPAGNYLCIGAERFSNPIMAALDRVRIHRGALTQDQLDSVAGTPKKPLTSTILAYDFNEAQAPYKSATVPARPAVNASTINEFLVQVGAPTFSTDTPSRLPGDFSMQFAAGQKVVVPDPNNVMALDPADPSFTIQAWLKFPTNQGTTRSTWFYCNEPNGAVSASITVTNNSRLFVTTLGIVDQPSSAFIPSDNGWHHVAIVHENGVAFRFYVDGVLGDTVPYDRGVTMNRAESSFYIGGESGTLYYTGLLDRFSYSKGALAPSAFDSVAVPGGANRPVLSVRNAVNNNQAAVLISWPAASTGFTLQQTLSLTPPQTWSTVTNTPSTDNQGFYLYFPPGPQRYFRLFKP
jgi:hypothetical protein